MSIFSPEESHFNELPTHWTPKKMSDWLSEISPIMISYWASSWTKILENTRLRNIAARISPDQFEDGRCRAQVVGPSIEEILRATEMSVRQQCGKASCEMKRRRITSKNKTPRRRT